MGMRLPNYLSGLLSSADLDVLSVAAAGVGYKKSSYHFMYTFWEIKKFFGQTE